MDAQDVDLEIRLSSPHAPSGAVSASTSIGSLGGFVSTTKYVLMDLFSSVTSDENVSLKDSCRCVFITNTHLTSPIYGVRAWVEESHGGADISLAVDPISATPINSSLPQAARTPNTFTLPPGIKFEKPVTSGTALFLGDIGPGMCRAIWIRRSSHDSSATRAAGGIIIVKTD